jgi:hypothetical protein
LEEDNYENDLTLLLFGSRYTNRVTTSQGFKVITNDMHGKAKSTQVYDNSGTLITSKDYFYNVVDPNAQRKQLNNTVPAMDANGSIPGSGMLIATDADLVTDVRESKSTSAGTSIGAYSGAIELFFIIPFGGFNYSATASTRTYNSVSNLKVIHQYGLLQEVRTTQNGSTLTADNLLWDAQTGDVLLTRNQNEFNDYTYSLKHPAFRAYDGMGSAYENIGAALTGFQTNANGTPVNYSGYLSPGDELVDIDPGATTRGWIFQSGDGTLRFIDQSGNFISGTGNYLIVRSGRRNMLDASAGTVVTMTNPLVQGGSGYILQTGVSQQVLDAKAITYKDEWGTQMPNFLTPPSTPPPVTFPLVQIQAGFPDYNLTANVANPDCSMNFFEAKVTKGGTGSIAVPIPTRGFIDFGSVPASGVPSNAIITSVILSLSPSSQVANPTTGINASYIRRVTQMLDCGTGTWATQPNTTTVHQASLAMSTSSSQSYNVDVTAMYNDWLVLNPPNGPMNPNDDQDFSVELILADEQTPTSRSMIFDGPAATNVPTLIFNFSVPGQCTNPVGQVLNPYYQGVKGDWRPDYNYVYQVSRVQVPGNSNVAGATNIRSSGYYNSFTPFWTNTTNTTNNNPQGTLLPIAPVAGSPGVVADPRWVYSNKSVYFDQKGNAVESVDALQRYSAVLYGYQQSLATAVATNARHNEIAFDGFEDYYFSLPQATVGSCPMQRQLDMGLALQGSQYCSGGNCIVTGNAHTGNYSLNLTGSINITKPWGNSSAPLQFLGFDQAGHGILLNNELAAGFSPVNTKSYVLSLWVNDGNPTSNLISGLQVSINGSSVNLSSLQVPVVEGWKQLTVTIPQPASSVPDFSLQLTGGANIYIDDLRLLPFDGQLKTFVYDDQSLRLMGQLDENNFGVLYEYDDEGIPIRVKKETERGMMTVKETRQSMMSQTPVH